MIVVKKNKFSNKNRPWCNPLPCPHPVTCPHYLSYLRTTPPQKKDLLGSYFWYAKIILRCQNMFYNSGEVTSDQFNHINLDSISWIFWKKSAKTKFFGNNFLWEGGRGGHLFQKVYLRIVIKKWTFWWRPKMMISPRLDQKELYGRSRMAEPESVWGQSPPSSVFVTFIIMAMSIVLRDLIMINMMATIILWR